jgi:hypothetical protein
MAADYNENEDFRDSQQDVYEKVIRAGKRTYFFDVRATKNNDFYLTITESKKRQNDDGSVNYLKHKIFLYKEDFEKFGEALIETFQKISELKNESIDESQNLNRKLKDIDFEDLA